MTPALPKNFNALGKYTPTETMRILDISRSSVYDRIKDGRLVAVLGRNKKSFLVTGKSILKHFNER